MEQEQQIEPTNQLPAYRYYGLLLFIIVVLGALLLSTVLSVMGILH